MRPMQVRLRANEATCCVTDPNRTAIFRIPSLSRAPATTEGHDRGKCDELIFSDTLR